MKRLSVLVSLVLCLLLASCGVSNTEDTVVSESEVLEESNVEDVEEEEEEEFEEEVVDGTSVESESETEETAEATETTTTEEPAPEPEPEPAPEPAPEPEPEPEVAAAPVEDTRPYIGYEGNCTVCGADGRDVYISREGLCDSCYNQMYPNGLYGRCTVCGVELTNGEAIAHGDRCDNCAKCDVCGIPLDYNHGNGWICQSCICATIPCPICGTIGVEPATGICYNCSYSNTGNCSICGNPLAPDGFCNTCMTYPQ